jgi:translation initiation factor 5
MHILQMVEFDTFRLFFQAHELTGPCFSLQTVIPNITDVASSLHRSPGEVNKFFGTELGAQSRYSPDTDKAIVNGAHTDGMLQDLMHRYIEKFVLCPNCRLPESEYKIKNDLIFHRCKACGAKEMVDMSHKLCNFILAEDKKAKKEAKSKGGKKTEKDEDKDSKKKKKSKDDSDEEKKKAKKEKKKEKKSKKEKKENGGDDEEDEDYIQAALNGSKKEDNELGSEEDESNEDDASEAGVDDAGALQLAVDATKQWLQERNDGFDIAQLVEFITNQQMASALKSHEKVAILVHAAFSEFKPKEEIPRFAPVLVSLTQQNPIMERHLIASLEVLCVDKPKHFPVLIKLLYDEDALQEETILAWADAGRSEYTTVEEEQRAILRGEAEPVVVWLQDSDSEDEDDDDE